MERTRLTVTDEQRKSVAFEYCKALDNGSKTSMEHGEVRALRVRCP